MKITHRIYLGTGTGANYPFVAARYNGTVTLYLEARINASSPPYVVQATADGTQKATCSTSSSSYELVKSTGWTQSVDAIISTSWVSGSGACFGLQLVIVQDTGDATALTATSHAWSSPRAGGYTASTTAVEPSTNTYWKYTSADFDGTVTCRFECEYYTTNSKGAVTIYVQEDDGTLTTWTTKATVVSAGTALSYTRVGATFTPTNGRTYRFVYFISSNKYYAYMRYGIPIIIQTGSPITKTVALAAAMDYNLGAEYVIESFWDNASDFIQCTRASRIRVFASTAATQSCSFDSLTGSTWTQFQTVATGSRGWFDAGSDASIPDTATKIRGYMSSNYSFQGHLVHRLVRTTYIVKTYTGSGYVKATGPSTSRTYCKVRSRQTPAILYMGPTYACTWGGKSNVNVGYRGITADWMGGIDPRGSGAGQWTVVATGGVYAAGIGARLKIKQPKGSGGMYTNGLSAIARIKVPHMAGGVYGSGAAALIKIKPYVAQGACAFWADGLAQVQLQGVKSWMASGFARLTGAATIIKTKYEKSEGGVYLAGQASVPKQKIIVPTGGIWTVGAAAIQKVKDVHNAVPVFIVGPSSGVSAKQWERWASGGLYHSGAATISKQKSYATPAQVWLDGVADRIRCKVRVYVGSGAVWLVGDGVTFKVKEFVWTASGGIWAVGDAYYHKNFYNATGGVYTSGVALKRLIQSTPTPGTGNSHMRPGFHLHNRTWMYKLGDWIPKKPPWGSAQGS